MFKELKQRGQALVLYAFALPTLLAFVGVAMDFGWWFFNQSRLQNAADAAVLAGASEIADSCTEPNAEIKVEFVNMPDTSLQYQRLIPTFDGDSKKVTETAKYYADKNFSYESLKSDENFFQDYAYFNAENFNKFLNDISSNETALLSPIYYVVELKGKADHLLMLMNIFGDMNLHVLAVARISGKNVPPPSESPGSNINEPMNNKMPEVVIIGNWEVQNWYYKNQKKWKDSYAQSYGHEKLFNGKWNHFRTENKNINNQDSKKRTNDRPSVYEENLDIYDNSPYTFGTPANGTQKYKADELESINLDFTQDFSFNLKSGFSYLTEDWDIGYPTNTDEISSIKNAGYGGTFNSRTHSQFSFGTPYSTRSDKNYPDLLGVRIESEPMWSKLGFQEQKTLNTVRQIVININQSNMSNPDDETTYRPLVFFYDGPETNVTNPNLTTAERASVKAKSAAATEEKVKVYHDSDGVKYINGVPYGENETPYIRDSQPVIINLNADFSGVFYMPNSPVVLNGNGKNFKGFIVAKKYLALKTEDDFTKSGDKYYDSYGNEYFRLVDNVNGFENVMFVDDKNNVQYKNVSDDFKYQYGEFEAFGGTLLEETFFTTDNNYYNFRIPKLSYNLLTYNDQAEEDTEDGGAD